MRALIEHGGGTEEQPDRSIMLKDADGKTAYDYASSEHPRFPRALLLQLKVSNASKTNSKLGAAASGNSKGGGSSAAPAPARSQAAEKVPAAAEAGAGSSKGRRKRTKRKPKTANGELQNHQQPGAQDGPGSPSSSAGAKSGGRKPKVVQLRRKTSGSQPASRVQNYSPTGAAYAPTVLAGLRAPRRTTGAKVRGTGKNPTVFQRSKSNSRQKGKERNARPTHFLAVRVKDEALRKRLIEVQQTLVERHPELKSCLTSMVKLHVTLGLFQLKKSGKSADLAEEAKYIGNNVESLKQALAKIASSHAPFAATFPGLGEFAGDVLFARVSAAVPLANYSPTGAVYGPVVCAATAAAAGGDETTTPLHALARDVQSALMSHGFGEQRPLAAHATIMKTSVWKAPRLQRPLAQLDAEADALAAIETECTTLSERINGIKARTDRLAKAAGIESATPAVASSAAAVPAVPVVPAVPAVPVSNLKSAPSRRALKPKIKKEWWNPEFDVLLGECVFDELEVLSMQGDDGDGYYPALLRVPLGGANN